MSAEFDDWSSRVSSWQNEIRDIPALVREDIIKAKIKPDEVMRGFQSMFYDPLSVQYAMGFKDRRYSLSYDVLKRIPHQLSIIGAILQTRCNQVASFAVPYRSSKDLGFMVKHKDPQHLTTKSELEMIKDIEAFLVRCGAKDPNPHNDIRRDDFETFLKKIVRDSLVYDQMCFEVVCDRRGVPYEFMAVDASTIRLAAANPDFSPNSTWNARKPPYNGEYLRLMDQTNVGPYRSLKLYDKVGKPDYVQVVNGQLMQTYTRDELVFGVRNPRTDIYIQGYGYGELEQLVSIITAHLNAESYNSKFFTQGSAPKGILNFKGDSMTPDQLEGFRRQWRANLEGVSNSWKTPILQSEQGLEWHDLGKTNRDMEYGQWLEYLIKISSAVFQIDPAELNFDLHGGVQQTPLFESSQEWKLKASRDKGLKPLLRFVAKVINDNIVSKIDDRFELSFSGLDTPSDKELHEQRMEEVSSYKTLNEVRRADDLPDLAYGDMPMNPTYLQAIQVKMQQEQQEQQSKQQAGVAPGQDVVQGDQGQEAAPTDNSPQYSDSFTKSASTTKFLEVSLDDFIMKVREEQ